MWSKMWCRSMSGRWLWDASPIQWIRHEKSQCAWEEHMTPRTEHTQIGVRSFIGSFSQLLTITLDPTVDNLNNRSSPWPVYNSEWLWWDPVAQSQPVSAPVTLSGLWGHGSQNGSKRNEKTDAPQRLALNFMMPNKKKKGEGCDGLPHPQPLTVTEVREWLGACWTPPMKGLIEVIFEVIFSTL